MPSPFFTFYLYRVNGISLELTAYRVASKNIAKRMLP